MNFDYISGFFDADGSITICKSKNDKYKYIKIDLTNVELDLLIEIQKYLHIFDIKSYISTKQARKDTHKISYSLSTSRDNALRLCKYIKSIHPKKKHRIQTALKYYKLVTSRNGKYTDKQHNRKLAFERLFMWSSFS